MMIHRRRQRPPATNEFLRMIEGQVALIEQENRRTLREWQTKSLEERGAGIIACCQSAATIMEARRQMGIKPIPRRPWPQHIWNMLRKHATEARNESHDAT
ncbi:MAG: hypothetical protein IAG10_28585 [Planctomycetaceae bacterium]|nr:hypothetical protein [Planctomycetaceae bacterium]